MKNYEYFTADYENTLSPKELETMDRNQLICMIQSLNKQVNALSKIARQDLQTNLLHKTAAEIEITHFLENKGKNGIHTLMLIDIDNFKKVNDMNGHLFGDGVICEFAEKLNSLCSYGDNIIGRAGGDEFIILLKNSLLSDAVRISKSICSALDKICIGSICRSISCSIGISCFPSDSRDFITLYEYADKALYHSKLLGKNRYSVYSPSIIL